MSCEKLTITTKRWNNLYINTGKGNSWMFSCSGTLLPNTDSSYDLGMSCSGFDVSYLDSEHGIVTEHTDTLGHIPKESCAYCGNDKFTDSGGRCVGCGGLNFERK